MDRKKYKYMTNLEYIRSYKRNMSRRHLAYLSGVNYRMIIYYESRVKDINKACVITVKKLADVLNCKIEDLIEKDE